MTNHISKLQRALEASFLGLPQTYHTTPHQSTESYPFYDVLQDKNGENIILQIALAGWNKEDIVIEAKRDVLTVTGNLKHDEYEVMNDKFQHIHKGISQKNFERSFSLTSDLVVDDADFTNGILTVKMHKEIPEKDKPRLIKL